MESSLLPGVPAAFVLLYCSVAKIFAIQELLFSRILNLDYAKIYSDTYGFVTQFNLLSRLLACFSSFPPVADPPQRMHRPDAGTESHPPPGREMQEYHAV